MRVNESSDSNDQTLEERARVDALVGYVMAKVRSLMEGQGPFKMALRGALRPRYRELIERIEAANITEKEMAAVLVEVWKQTRAILDRDL